KELETLLRTTLMSAERASAELKEQARREAELILGEAHAEARKLQRDSIAENERLITESRRPKAQLRAARETIDDVQDAEDAPAVPRESLTLVSGHRGRDKIVELAGLGPAVVERRLASASTADRSRKDSR